MLRAYSGLCDQSLSGAQGFWYCGLNPGHLLYKTSTSPTVLFDLSGPVLTLLKDIGQLFCKKALNLGGPGAFSG